MLLVDKLAYRLAVTVTFAKVASPPVMATALAFCVAIVPRPDTLAVEIAMATLAAFVILPCASIVI